MTFIASVIAREGIAIVATGMAYLNEKSVKDVIEGIGKSMRPNSAAYNKRTTDENVRIFVEYITICRCYTFKVVLFSMVSVFIVLKFISIITNLCSTWRRNYSKRDSDSNLKFIQN